MFFDQSSLLFLFSYVESLTSDVYLRDYTRWRKPTKSYSIKNKELSSLFIKWSLLEKKVFL